jgi:hypothetical protein
MKILLTCIILGLSLSNCRTTSPQPTTSIAFKTLNVGPTLRCPTNRILSASWGLTEPGGISITLSTSNIERIIYISEEDDSTIEVDVIEAIADIPNFPDTYRIIITPISEVRGGSTSPYAAGNRLQGDSKTFEITTIIAPTEIERPAVRRGELNEFVLGIDPLLYSSDLTTDKITMATGCSNPMSGRYSWDKGLTVANTEVLSISNNFSDTFNPTTAQGEYLIRATEQPCDKSISEVKLKLRFSCPTQ